VRKGSDEALSNASNTLDEMKKKKVSVPCFKYQNRYSADVAAAHRLLYTVPAARQSLSVDTQSVQIEPVPKSIIHRRPKTTGKKTHIEQLIWVRS